jgi:hypothetical protein
VRSHGDARVFEDAVLAFDRRGVDRHARVVDGLVTDAERIGLRRPAIPIDSLGGRGIADGLDLIDRHHFALSWLRDEVPILVAPPRRHVAAEQFAAMRLAAAGTRTDIEDADLEHVAGLRAIDVDRTRADMHAEAFSGSAAVDACIHRSRAAPVDGLLPNGPAEDAFRTGVAVDHPLGIVGRMLRQRLDGDDIARANRDHRRQQAAQESPVDRLVRDRHVMVIGRPFAGIQ